MVLRFGDYELDEAAGELRCRGRAVDVQPKPLALLALLIRERARTVPTSELLETLWPDTSVTLASLTRAVSHARRAIGDTNKGELIKSVSRRGYRFVGPLVELERASDAAGANAPASDSSAPFVGREDELARLERSFAEAVGGRGAVAVVTGPAGIGKTRLVERFASQSAARGARVAFGRNRAEEGVPPFWLWLQVLRQLLGEEPPPPELASDSSDRFGVFDAVTRTLARLSR